MTGRRGKRKREDKVERGRERHRLALNLINTALRESGLCACISSRITTVIHVVRDHQINDN
jgi:Tfp pilus assembly protein PilW